MSDNFWAWVAEIAPRRLVMQCLLRVVNHCRGLDDHATIKSLTAYDLTCAWREVVNGEEMERR